MTESIAEAMVRLGGAYIASAPDADVDYAYCAWCDHHAEVHDYRPDPIACAGCPDGICHREAAL